MTVISEDLTPIIEVVTGNGTITSSYINMRVLRNPIPIDTHISEANFDN